MAKSAQPTAAPARRVVLAAAAAGAVLLAGCRGVTALGPAPRPSADVGTLKDAITAEEALITRYHAALGALGEHGATAGVLRTVLAEHEDHLRRLRTRLIQPPDSASTGQPSAASSATAAPAVPSGRHQILASLIAAEHAAAARLAGQMLLMPSATAQVMASISASEASHVVALNRAGKAG